MDPHCDLTETVKRTGTVIIKPQNQKDSAFHPYQDVGRIPKVNSEWKQVSIIKGEQTLYLLAHHSTPNITAQYPGMSQWTMCQLIHIGGVINIKKNYLLGSSTTV